MVVRELLSVLKFETDEARVQSFEKSITNLTKGLALLVTGATAAATAAFGFASSTARQSEEISRSAKLASTGVEEFQKLAYASESFGIQQDKLADILKDVNDKMGDYAQTGGGAMADFFEFIAPKIGVTADQFRNLSGADALQLYVSSLEKANLSQADMTFYMEAIASDSTLLLPLLEKNGEAYKVLAKEAEEYGAIISEDNVKANKVFSQQLRSLNKMFQAVIMSVGNKLIPVFSDLVSKVKDFIARNRELIQTNISDFFDGAIWVVKQFISVLGILFGWIDKVAQLMGGWSNAIKIVGIAVGVLMALKFIPWVIAATAAIKALNIAMLLNPASLMIAGIIALGTAIVLLIEDMYNWVKGNESVVGDLIATWFEFITKFKGYLKESLESVKEKLGQIKGFFIDTFTEIKDFVAKIFKNIWDGITGGVTTAFNKIKSFIPDISLNPFSSNPTPTTQSVMGSNGSSLSSVVNDNKTINITVPPGATTEQVEAIKQQINKTMAQQYTDAAQHLEGY